VCCSIGNAFSGRRARVLFDVTAGTTYHLQFGDEAGGPLPVRVRRATKPFPVVARQGQFHVRNSFTTGVATSEFRYGSGSAHPIFGDWNGDGLSTVGVVRGNTWYLRNSVSTGVADLSFAYGSGCDHALTLRQALTRAPCDA
jgi:hypothetical protein